MSAIRGPHTPRPGRYQDPPVGDLVHGTAQLIRLQSQRPHRRGDQAGQRSRPLYHGETAMGIRAMGDAQDQGA